MNKAFFENILPGTRLFGSFRLVRSLGSTEMGGVYLCQDTRKNNQLIALKILNNRLGPTSEFKRQFLREIEISRTIDHPNTIKIFEFFKDEDFLAYTMEYLLGGSLDERIAAKRLPDMMTAVSWLKQIASGLEAIHKKGIVHRDLKPENILLGENNQIKIVDFGISLQYGQSDEVPSDTLMGTVNFLSPEYIRHGIVDYRSDLYAWGVVAYQLLTGRLPYHGDNLVETLTLRVTQDPIAPQRINPAIPQMLGDLILSSLRRDPSKRVQSATELCSRLEEYMNFYKKIQTFQRANEDSQVMKTPNLKAIA